MNKKTANLHHDYWSRIPIDFRPYLDTFEQSEKHNPDFIIIDKNQIDRAAILSRRIQSIVEKNLCKCCCSIILMVDPSYWEIFDPYVAIALNFCGNSHTAIRLRQLFLN